MQKSVRDRAPIAVATVNIDDDMGFGSTRKNMASDVAMSDIVRILKESVRTYDVVGHLDAGKFAVIMQA